MPTRPEYVLAAQQLALAAGLDQNTSAYRRAQGDLQRAYEASERGAATAAAIGTGSGVAGGVAVVGAVAGGVATLGAGTGGAGFATAAAISAAAGPVGLIASLALLGVAGVIGIIGQARKSRAKALAAAGMHGASREWGRAYLHYWSVFGRNPTSLIAKGAKLVDRINKLKGKKRQTKKRKKRIKQLQLRASALSTVMLEVGVDAPYPAQSIVDAPVDPGEDALDDRGDQDVDADADAFLPKLIIGLSFFSLFL